MRIRIVLRKRDGVSIHKTTPSASKQGERVTNAS